VVGWSEPLVELPIVCVRVADLCVKLEDELEWYGTAPPVSPEPDVGGGTYGVELYGAGDSLAGGRLPGAVVGGACATVRVGGGNGCS
jgi:hypothetical protein